MSNKFTLKIITPARVLFLDEADSVELPGKDGEFQVLPGHTPFLTTLKIGPVIVKKNMDKVYLAISGGFCEVLPDKTTIIAHSGELDNEIDRMRAENARDRAKNRIEEAPRNKSIDIDRAELALKRAVNRLRVSGMGQY